MEEVKNVVIFALASGEHIICEATLQDYSYLCSNVLQIVSQGEATSGKMQMGLIPYLPFSDPEQGIGIPTNMAILAMPSESLLNNYNKIFGRIMVPPTPKIILS